MRSRKRWYLDTEFHEDGRVIDLISIALVADTGEFYYAVSTEFNPSVCNDWVKANVLPKLPPRDAPQGWWKSRSEIASDLAYVLLPPNSKPEIWGYFADYDWVALCQLWGRMIDLPAGLPMWCRDLKQVMQERGIEKDLLPQQDPASEHDALADARWIRLAHQDILASENS